MLFVIGYLLLGIWDIDLTLSVVADYDTKCLGGKCHPEFISGFRRQQHVMLNLFQHLGGRNGILKQVQDDTGIAYEIPNQVQPDSLIFSLRGEIGYHAARSLSPP